MNTFGVLSEVNGRICSLITAALSKCRNFRQLAVVELRNRYTVSLPISEEESVAWRYRNRFLPVNTREKINRITTTGEMPNFLAMLLCLSSKAMR